MTCRFVLSEIDEGEIENEDGYSIFEPKVTLIVDGNNVFQPLGVDGTRYVVIMHFREAAIDKTLKMIRDSTATAEIDGEYKYHLLGTGFSFILRRKGRWLDVYLEAGNGGPTKGVNKWPQTVHVAKTTVQDWVEAVLSLSKMLSEMFRRLNAVTYSDPIFQKDEAKLARLEDWTRTNASQPAD